MRRAWVGAVACAVLLLLTACEPTKTPASGKTSPSSTLHDGTYSKVTKAMRGTWTTAGGPKCKWTLVANHKQVKRGKGRSQTIKIGMATTKFESRFCGTWRRK